MVGGRLKGNGARGLMDMEREEDDRETRRDGARQETITCRLMSEVIMYPRPAYCAATVAIAAPLMPIPSQGTSTRSPKRFKAPANQTALRGVTASLSPKHAA